GNGGDLPLEEAVVLGANGALLALQRELVHLLATDLLADGDVFRRLAHGDVDIGIFLGVARYEPWVVGVWRVGVAAAIARNAFDTDGEENIALAGLDGMRGHAG